MKHLWLLLLCGPVFAGGIDQRTDVNTPVEVNTEINGGDTLLGDSRAYGFSHALGDVDINQCMASQQFGTILFSKQKLVINRWCMAESYDARGLHDMAALLRCDIEEVAKHFDNQADCLKANTVQVVVMPAPVPRMESKDEAEDGDHSELLARLEAIEKARHDEARRAQAAARAAHKAAQEVQQKRIEDAEYAQQMLEELKEWQ